MSNIEAGKTYEVSNQGNLITPKTNLVEVVWVEDGHVHYRIVGTTEIKQTPNDRFLEIISQQR